jgi:lipoyl(octanoyl) transferase
MRRAQGGTHATNQPAPLKPKLTSKIATIAFPMNIHALGRTEFSQTWQRMRAFTDARGRDTDDELWMTEHNAVFTQGVAGKPEHLLVNPTNIPVIKTDRGGQITFHGPGQAVVYCLIDLRRKAFGVRELVQRVESAVIGLLEEYDVAASGRRDAPGVYVNGNKIASLGLKVRNGCTYHGVALNVDGDLTPFSYTNPCGLVGMQMTRCADHGISLSTPEAGLALARHLQRRLEST